MSKKNRKSNKKPDFGFLYAQDINAEQIDDAYYCELVDIQLMSEMNETLIGKSPGNLKSRDLPFLGGHQAQNIEKVTTGQVLDFPKKVLQQKPEDRRRKLSVHEMGRLLIKKENIINVNGMLFCYQNPLYRPMGESEIIAMLIKHLSDDELNRLNIMDYKGAYQYLFSVESIKRKQIPIIKNCVMFQNGYFNIVTSKELAISPNHIVTSMAQANYTPFNCRQTPVFDRFLDDCSQGDPEIEILILSMLGYCLIPDLDGKCFFVLGTAPNSGKSVIGELLKRLVGEESVSSISLADLQNSFALGPLVGKSLNLSMDLSSELLSASTVGRIKMLTGGDLVIVNEKYRPMFSYSNIAKFVFASNSPVKLKKPDSAFWDRMVLVPFMNSISKEEQDKDLIDKLWLERDGIITKAMVAARELIENNYIFPDCHRSIEMKNSWDCQDYSGIIQFVRNCCELGFGFRTHSNILYQAYLEFCSRSGFGVESENRFSRVLKDIFGLTNDRWSEDGKNALRGFIGIILSDKLIGIGGGVGDGY